MQHTWYTKQGTVKVLRKSSDSVWPLRDAYGRTYADYHAKLAVMRALVAKAHGGEVLSVGPDNMGPMRGKRASVVIVDDFEELEK